MSILTGAIKNALEKGESLDLVAQSFINAGYAKEEIDKAINEINSQGFYRNENPIANPQPAVQGLRQQIPFEAKSNFKPLPTIGFEENKRPFKIYIFLGIIAILILIGAALLGLYWNKLF